MTLQEIQTLVAAGYTKADIDLLQQAPVVQPQQSLVVQPEVPAQPQTQQAQPQSNDFLAALAALGAAINQPTQQPQPTNALPASLQPQAQQPQPYQAPAAQPQTQVAPIATTPSNAGITPEEATKLFQAWSMGQATQNIELPPTADEVLAKRFASLYGVDTTQNNNK